jgi:metallo-beta-lactamase class B
VGSKFLSSPIPVCEKLSAMELRWMVLTLWILAGVQDAGMFPSDPAVPCEACGQWNRDREPFRVFGNTYYVGVEGLSSILVSTDAGLILLDGGLPQSSSLIDAHIRKLGFRTENIRLIVNSHAHFDHAGGIGALQRASNAIVAASPSGALAMKQGHATEDDPQSAYIGTDRYLPIKNVRAVRDGEVLRVGSQEITAHFTPGHTPGGTTWTWRSCEGTRCLNIVYADSLTSVSDPAFRYTGDGKRASIVESFRNSIRRVEQLPCDIMISVHPSFSNLFKNLERRNEGIGEALINTEACRGYAATALQDLQRRVTEEQGRK